MKIATRLTILLVVLTFMVALLVGWFAVDASTRAQYSTLDSQINLVIKSGTGNPDAALSNALNVVQENGLRPDARRRGPLGVGRAGQPRVRALAREADPLSTCTPPWARSVSSRTCPVFASVRSTSVAVTTWSSRDRRVRSSPQGRRLALDVALIRFLVAIVMLVLARMIMRKDLRTMEHLIGFASEVARGDERGTIPPSAGSRDVRELQAALATMVVALHERIAIEERSVEAMQQFVGDASRELRPAHSDQGLQRTSDQSVDQRRTARPSRRAGSPRDRPHGPVGGGPIALG